MNTKLGKHGGLIGGRRVKMGRIKLQREYTQLTVNNFLKCLYVTVICLCVYICIYI